jgi:hypothetical protein
MLRVGAGCCASAPDAARRSGARALALPGWVVTDAAVQAGLLCCKLPLPARRMNKKAGTLHGNFPAGAANGRARLRACAERLVLCSLDFINITDDWCVGEDRTGTPGWRRNSSVSGICEADAAARVTNDRDVSRLARLSSNY